MAKRQFNDVSYQRLKNAIADLPGLAESLSEQNLSLHKLSEIHVFGYGSLPDQPHYPPQKITDAYLWGYSRDLCCKSVRSGTSKFTGLTLGLDQNEDGIVPGAILTYKNLPPLEMCEMLEQLSQREVVKELPIYKFKMLEIEKADGSKVMAITCVADQDSIGYHGDGLSPMEKKDLTKSAQYKVSLSRKAKIIAEASGFYPKSGIHATSKSYFDRFVRFPIENNPVSTDPADMRKLSELDKKRRLALAAEQDRMLTLAGRIDYYRDRMKQDLPELVKILEKAEAKQIQLWKQKKKKASKKRTPPFKK